MHWIKFIIFNLVLTLSLMNTIVNAEDTQPKAVYFFNQKLPLDSIIEKYYYSKLPFEFLALKGCLYLHDDELSIPEPHAHTMDLNLFFNEAIQLKKIDVSWEVLPPNPTAVKGMTFNQIQTYQIAHGKSALTFHLDEEQSRKLRARSNRVTFKIETARDAKDLKMDVQAYGLNRNAIFMIVRHLLHTRNDKILNEALLRSLYLNGYTSLLPLFKYEEYSKLYVTEESLFYLPINTDFSIELHQMTAHLKKGKYLSKEGIKTLPSLQHPQEKFLYIDQKKIRFLRLKDPQESIKIKKIDLAN